MLNRVVLAGCAALSLAACASEPNRPASPIGAAAPGVVIGSRVSSPRGEGTLGALQGGVLGADIGRSISAADRALAERAEYEALEYGRAGVPTEWRNPDTRTTGKVVVGSAYQVNLLDCREYTHTVYVEGRARVARGTACREPDADWRVIN